MHYALCEVRMFNSRGARLAGSLNIVRLHTKDVLRMPGQALQATLGQ